MGIKLEIKKPTGVFLTEPRFFWFSRLIGKQFHVIKTVKRRI